MKNLLIAALIAFFANVGFVQAEQPVSKTDKTEPNVLIQEIGNFQYKIDFDDVTSPKAWIEVIGEDGNVYFQGSYNTDKSIVLNFTNLTNGNYIISVVSDNERINHVFEVKNKANKVVISVP